MGSQFVGSTSVAECTQNSDCCNKASICQSNQTLVDENPGSPFPIPAAICDCFPLGLCIQKIYYLCMSHNIV